MISAKQALLARTMIDLSQAEAAQLLGWAHQTLSKIENGQVNPPASRLKELQDFYENSGVEFLDGDGVRRKQAYVRQYSGTPGFRAFMDDVFETARDTGGEICLLNAKPDNWIKWLGADWYADHTKRMQTLLDKINFKVTIREGDYNFIGGKHSEYRWVPEEVWNEQSFYAYGDRIGFLNFEENSVKIFVLRQRQFADSFRFLFNIAWNQITMIPDRKDHKPQ